MSTRRRARRAAAPAVRARARGGFTIISMLVAIILLAVGLTSLATASGNTVKMQTLAQNRTNAIAIARSYMEEVRTRDPWTLQTESPSKLDADGQVTVSGAFTRTMTVAVVRQNLLRIDVAVDYPRSSQPVTLTTSYFRGNGLANIP